MDQKIILNKIIWWMIKFNGRVQKWKFLNDKTKKNWINSVFILTCWWFYHTRIYLSREFKLKRILTECHVFTSKQDRQEARGNIYWHTSEKRIFLPFGQEDAWLVYVNLCWLKFWTGNACPDVTQALYITPREVMTLEITMRTIRQSSLKKRKLRNIYTRRCGTQLLWTFVCRVVVVVINVLLALECTEGIVTHICTPNIVKESSWFLSFICFDFTTLKESHSLYT